MMMEFKIYLNVQSENVSFIDSQINHIESSISEHQSSLLDKVETLNSTTSSLNDSFKQTLYIPKVRRSMAKKFFVHHLH